LDEHANKLPVQAGQALMPGDVVVVESG